MENDINLKEDLEKCFETLNRLIDESFVIIAKNPEKESWIIDLWKGHISKFMSHTLRTGDKHNNKGVFKAITKALIFGR